MVTQDSTGLIANQLDGPKARANFYLDTQEINSLTNLKIKSFFTNAKNSIAHF